MMKLEIESPEEKAILALWRVDQYEKRSMQSVGHTLKPRMEQAVNLMAKKAQEYLQNAISHI